MIDIFVLNACVYLVTFFCILYKYRELNLYVTIWLFNTIVAFMGAIIVVTGIHYSGDKMLGFKVSPIPYLCIYLSNLIMTSPLKKIKSERMNFKGFSDSSFLKKIVYLSIFIFIPVITLRTYEVYTISKMGYGEAYLMTYEGDNVIKYSNPILSAISKWGVAYCNLFTPVLILFFVSRLAERNGKMYKNIMGIFIGFLPVILSSISKGSKGSLFFVSWDILFYYIICNKLIPQRTNKVIRKVGLVLFSVIIVWAIFIQEGRNKISIRNDSTTEVFYRYLGEAMPNVGWEVYDKVKWNPNGRRFYPELFSGEGDRLSLTHDEWHQYWGNKIGVRVQKFHTFWGDSYMEFGLANSLIYIIFITFLWNKFIFKYANNVSYVPLICFYYHYFLIWGAFGHGGFSGSNKHIMFGYLVIVCLFVEYFTRKRHFRDYSIINISSLYKRYKRKLSKIR